MSEKTPIPHLENQFFYLPTMCNRAWHIMLPPIFRFMASTYVEEFMNEGKIRLSSFNRFSSYTDEQRGDNSEGWSIVVNLAANDETLIGAVRMGSDAYVLCGTTNLTTELRKNFDDCDGCIVIDNPLGFADAISNRIPFFRLGLFGQAIYRDTRTLQLRRYDPTIKELFEKHGLEYNQVDDDDATVEKKYNAMPDELKTAIFNNLQNPESLFLKRSKFSSQSEYRLFWHSTRPIDEYIDIVVPEAVQFCRRVIVPTD